MFLSEFLKAGVVPQQQDKICNKFIVMQ